MTLQNVHFPCYIVTINFTGKLGYPCPKLHPYSFNHGHDCCSHPNEQDLLDDTGCTGGPFLQKSPLRCCSDHQSCKYPPCKAVIDGHWATWTEWEDEYEFCRTAGYKLYSQTVRNRTCRKAIGGVQHCTAHEMSQESSKKQQTTCSGKKSFLLSFKCCTIFQLLLKVYKHCLSVA